MFSRDFRRIRHNRWRWTDQPSFLSGGGPRLIPQKRQDGLPDFGRLIGDGVVDQSKFTPQRIHLIEKRQHHGDGVRVERHVVLEFVDEAHPGDVDLGELRLAASSAFRWVFRQNKAAFDPEPKAIRRKRLRPWPAIARVSAFAI